MKKHIVSTILVVVSSLACSQAPSEFASSLHTDLPQAPVTDADCRTAQNLITRLLRSHLTGAGITAAPFTGVCKVSVLHRDGKSLLGFVDASLRLGMDPLEQQIKKVVGGRLTVAHVGILHTEVGVISAGPAVPGEEFSVWNLRAPTETECKASVDRLAERYMQPSLTNESLFTMIGVSQNLVGTCNVQIGFKSGQFYRSFVFDRVAQGLSPMQEIIESNGKRAVIEFSAVKTGEISAL